MNLEVVTVAGKLNRLTVAKNRVTVKLSAHLSEEERQNMQDFLTLAAYEVVPVNFTLRGFVIPGKWKIELRRDNGVIVKVYEM